MGFFSSLFGKKSGHSGSVYGSTDSGGGWHDKVNASDPDDRDCRRNMKTVRARVERVMNEEWCSRDGAYEIRREIGAYDMEWPEMEEIQETKTSWGHAHSRETFFAHGLFRDGRPVAMVLFLPNNSCYNRRDVRAFHRACENRGIFCMNLMPKFPNCYAYIKERLTENVRL